MQQNHRHSAKALSIISDWLNKNRDVGIFLLRLFVAVRIIYGVRDNILSWEHMLAFSDFLDKFHFPLPLTSALISVYVQFICGLLILVGHKIRPAAFLLILNFLVALLMVHPNDSFESMTPALALLFSCTVLLFYGQDKYSIKRIVPKNPK